MNRRGFTLIELLIVIAILGILIALILPRFSDVRADANRRVCVANLRGLASAMATYETRENTPPGFTWVGRTVAQLVTDGYLASEPRCPLPAGGDYVLVDAAAGPPPVPARATCPNVGAAADHVWP